MTIDSITASHSRDAVGIDPLEVCTLSAGGLEERLAWIRAEILVHAVSRERSPDGITWELEDVPGLTAKLDRLVVLERECCSGIVFEHRPSATARRRVLEVRGIDPRAAVFAALQDPGEPPRLVERIAKAAGLGTLLSLLVCCVLPIGAVALLGAAATAPFASLDDPWLIGGSALLFGGGAFAWQSWRRAASASTRGAASCGPGCNT